MVESCMGYEQKRHITPARVDTISGGCKDTLRMVGILSKNMSVLLCQTY